MHNPLRTYIEQFVRIPDSDWEAIASQFHTRQYPKRSFFVSEGKYSTEIGFIVKGAFRQFFVVEGEEKTTFFSFEGDFVTDYNSFLNETPSEMNFEAVEDSELIVFNKETLQRLYRLYPRFESFGRMVAEAMYLCAMRRLHTFLLKSPEERYRHFLQEPISAEALERIPQHYIASYLGITPVSLSRIRSRIRTAERTAHKKNNPKEIH